MQISKLNFHLHTLHPLINGSLRWPIIKCMPYKPADTNVSPKGHGKLEEEKHLLRAVLLTACMRHALCIHKIQTKVKNNF